MLTPPRKLPAEYQRSCLGRHSWPSQDRHPFSPRFSGKFFQSMWRRRIWLDWRSILAKSYQFLFPGHWPSELNKCSGKISVLDRHMGSDAINWCTMQRKLAIGTDRVRARCCIHWQSRRACRSFRARRQTELMGEGLRLDLARIYPRSPDIRQVWWAQTQNRD